MVQDLLLQWLCHLISIDFLRTSANQASSSALGLASVILIFLIFVSLNTITLFSVSLFQGSISLRYQVLFFNVITDSFFSLFDM